MQFTENQLIGSRNQLIKFLTDLRKLLRIKTRIKIGSRESKNTKNYTGSLLLKGYIQSLCQQAKKFTQELKVQTIQTLTHLHPTRNLLHPAKYDI